MDKNKLINKLINNTGISKEEAEKVLSSNEWDILQAIVCLENQGRIKKQTPTVFYTNEQQEDYYTKENYIEDKKFTSEDFQKSRKFDGISEVVCKFIDAGNSIFLQFKKNDRVLLRLPITVMVLLLIFTFWVTIPLMILALFLDIELHLSTNRINKKNINKINKVLTELSKSIKTFKSRWGKGD